VITERGRRDVAAGRAMAAGLTESLAYGVTTIGDITTESDDVSESAAAHLTLRLGEPRADRTGPDVFRFVEVIAFSRARADSALAAVKGRLEELSRARPNARLGISPHAPYTVSPNLLQELIVLACERKMPVAMHLAETTDELEFLRAGTGAFQSLLDERSMWDAAAVPRESRPLDYLRLLAKAPRALVIHGNYLDTEEHAYLATRRERMSLVYCPRTHEYFEHAPYPLAELVSAGVNVALGTDSRASNPDLDLLSEMRQVAQIHPKIDLHAILRMGTIAGAKALGCDDEIGTVAPGKLANLIAIPLTNDAGKTPNDMLDAILANPSRPTAVWFRGRQSSVM
jgi:cytosine/adenosine deaminase-related metal-dependent hydrolase